MKSYVDYGFYSSVFLGTVIDSESFDRMALEASYFVRELTFGRIGENPSDDVKMATCAVAEIEFKEKKQNEEDQIASESVGPHSVSYVKKTKNTEEYAKDKIRAVQMYLSGTGLLYRGLASCSL